jgi:esterase
MNLYFKELGEGTPLVILHGFLGTGDNWYSLGKRFAEHFHVYIVDQRNHGNSPHSNEFGYQEMADDLVEFFREQHITKAHILGHSMGGKVAMLFAMQNPLKVEKLIVADIAPRYYPPHHQDILDGLNGLDLKKLTSRQDADDQLAKKIDDFGVRQFLLKNLNRSSDGFSWKMNLPVLTRKIDKVGLEIGKGVVYEGPSLFIKGGKSRYIRAEDVKEIERKFPNSQIKEIEGAGHWLHAEQPDTFYDLTMEFLHA